MPRRNRSPHRPPSLVPIFERHFKELDVWFQAQVDLSVGGGVFRTLSLSSLSSPLIRGGGGGGSGKGQKTGGGGSGSGEIAGGTDGGQGEAGRVESKGEFPPEGVSVGTRGWNSEFGIKEVTVSIGARCSVSRSTRASPQVISH